MLSYFFPSIAVNRAIADKFILFFAFLIILLETAESCTGNIGQCPKNDDDCYYTIYQPLFQGVLKCVLHNCADILVNEDYCTITFPRSASFTLRDVGKCVGEVSLQVIMERGWDPKTAPSLYRTIRESTDHPCVGNPPTRALLLTEEDELSPTLYRLC